MIQYNHVQHLCTYIYNCCSCYTSMKVRYFQPQSTYTSQMGIIRAKLFWAKHFDHSPAVILTGNEDDHWRVVETLCLALILPIG